MDDLLEGKPITENDKRILDCEVAPHEAGEQASEVVSVDLEPNNRTIYLEYE